MRHVPLIGKSLSCTTYWMVLTCVWNGKRERKKSKLYPLECFVAYLASEWREQILVFTCCPTKPNLKSLTSSDRWIKERLLNNLCWLATVFSPPRSKHNTKISGTTTCSGFNGTGVNNTQLSTNKQGKTKKAEPNMNLLKFLPVEAHDSQEKVDICSDEYAKFVISSCTSDRRNIKKFLCWKGRNVNVCEQDLQPSKGKNQNRRCLRCWVNLCCT